MESYVFAIDLQPLCNTIKWKHLHLLTTEEIFSQMFSSCFVSKLDACSGYWQIKVDEESSHLLAFGTPLGRYCFKRLPYRINSANEVFQLEITSIISDFPDIANSQDDTVAWVEPLPNIMSV